MDGNTINIVGTIALCNFPMWEQSVKELARHVDVILVRYDAINGDPEILKTIPALEAEIGKKIHVKIVDEPWRPPRWRQDMLKMADEYKPDIVVDIDEDEVYGEGFDEELKSFWFSDKDAMLFQYEPLITETGEVVNEGVPYPPEPHMKTFKWKEGLSYWPWHKSAKVAQYANKENWQAKTKIKHYCAYTEKMRQNKKWRSDRPCEKQRKAVTIIGFGNSAKGEMQLIGEVWGLNNCYEVFTPDLMREVTRIYDIHYFGPRNSGHWLEIAKSIGKTELQNRDHLTVRDGRFHIDHLKELSEIGHRIILQEKHPKIKYSEAYPLKEVEAATGLVRFFVGTAPYMIAQAIYEGYDEIRIYGFDQMDWEHIRQRESCTGWLMYAAGRGIKISGALTFLDRTLRRYGYEFGPEFDAEENKQLWAGFPFEMMIRNGMESVRGEMHKPDHK